MTLIDVVMLVLVLLSVLMSIYRGFVREVFALAAWIGAAAAAYFGWEPLKPWLVDYVPYFAEFVQADQVRNVASAATIFLVVLFLGTLLAVALEQLVRRTGIGGTDRMLGTFFGLLRGVVVITVLVGLVFFLDLDGLTEQQMWSDSALMPHVYSVLEWLHPQLPAEWADRILPPSPSGSSASTPAAVVPTAP